VADLTTISLGPKDPMSLERMNQIITASPDRFVLVLDQCVLEEGGAAKLAAIADDEPKSVIIIPSLDGEVQMLDLRMKGLPSAYMIVVNRLFTRIGSPYVDSIYSHAQIIQHRVNKRRGEAVHTSAVNAISL
jgi:hypothetical protein